MKKKEFQQLLKRPPNFYQLSMERREEINKEFGVREPQRDELIGSQPQAFNSRFRLAKKYNKTYTEEVPSSLKLLNESISRGRSQKKVLKKLRLAEKERKKAKFVPFEVWEYRKTHLKKVI